MPVTPGFSAGITFASGDVTNPFEFTTNINVAMLRSTVFGATSETYIAGLISGDGSYGVHTDDTVARNPTATGAATFTSSAGRTVSGTIFISGTSSNSGLDDTNKTTYTFNFSGVITTA